MPVPKLLIMRREILCPLQTVRDPDAVCRVSGLVCLRAAAGTKRRSAMSVEKTIAGEPAVIEAPIRAATIWQRKRERRNNADLGRVSPQVYRW